MGLSGCFCCLCCLLVTRKLIHQLTVVSCTLLVNMDCLRDREDSVKYEGENYFSILCFHFPLGVASPSEILFLTK